MASDEIDERLREAARAAFFAQENMDFDVDAAAIDHALNYRELVEAARAVVDAKDEMASSISGVVSATPLNAAINRLRRALPTKGGG